MLFCERRKLCYWKQISIFIIFFASTSSHLSLLNSSEFSLLFFFSEWERTDWAKILARTHQHSSITACLVFNRFEISPNIWPNYSLSYSHTSVPCYSLFITLNNSLSSLASTLLKHFRAEVTFFSLLLKQVLRM